MVYKNFTLRLIFSLLFLLIYFFISIIDFQLVFFLIIIIYFTVFLEIFINFKKSKLLPFLYIFISLTFFLNIDFNDKYLKKFNLFIFIIISFDVFSYGVGKLIGRNKLIKLSPNKTIEGLIGGILFSLTLSIFFAYFLNTTVNIKLIFFIILIITSAFFGDLIESYFKRINNLKNSSELIPGHGGVFDRFDSFLFSIIFYSISTYIYI